MPTSSADPFPHLAGELLESSASTELADLFKALANENRLRILHAIHRAGEAGTSDIAEAIDASQQSVSNHLQRLADQGIVRARRDGQRVRYRIVDPCVPGLMDLGVCLLSQRESTG